MDNSRGTWAEIDLAAIKHNIKCIREAVPEKKVMAVVKANAYGHGMPEVAKTCVEEGIEFLGVATLEEALTLRNLNIKIPILVLGYINPDYAEIVVKNEIRPSVFSVGFAQQLSKAALKINSLVHLHLKIDTGMGRIGFKPDQASVEQIKAIADLPGISVEGIFTHFAVADIEDKTYTWQQINLLNRFIDNLEKEGISIPLKHVANSAAIIDMPELHCNMVRAGIMLYGLYPSNEIKKSNCDIIPAMSLKSHISYIKTLTAGQTVSYGRTYTCPRDTIVATVPIGYADGYSRLLSNQVWAVVNGVRVPQIGTICMDQCMFDVTRVEGIKEGQEIILFGKPAEGITVDDLAKIINTINYEVVCSISSRVPRVYR